MHELSPVYALLRQPSMVDFPGRSAAVGFVSGCNFHCGFCHNAALLGAVQPGMPWAQLEKACAALHANWIRAAVVTGGEPTLHAGLDELIAFFRARGWAVKLDTNGSRPEVLARVAPQVDYVAMDIKCAAEDYPKRVRFPHPERIRASVDLLRQGATPYEFRMTVIESWHPESEAPAIGELVRGAKRLALQPFVPRDDLPDPAFRVMKRTAPAFLHRWRELLAPYVEQVETRNA